MPRLVVKILLMRTKKHIIVLFVALSIVDTPPLLVVILTVWTILPLIAQVKPGLHEPQLPVKRSVTLVSSVVVERTCSSVALLQLLNVDYKIVCKVYANHISAVLSELWDQCSVPSRVEMFLMDLFFFGRCC